MSNYYVNDPTRVGFPFHKHARRIVIWRKTISNCEPHRTGDENQGYCFIESGMATSIKERNYLWEGGWDEEEPPIPLDH